MKRIACVIVAGCGSGVHGSPGTGIDWTAASESLVASELTLIVDGVTFHGTIDQFELKSGTGDVMDVTWAEAGYTPRIHFDFATDGGTWWIGSADSVGYGVRADRLAQTHL